MVNHCCEKVRLMLKRYCVYGLLNLFNTVVNAIETFKIDLSAATHNLSSQDKCLLAIFERPSGKMLLSIY